MPAEDRPGLNYHKHLLPAGPAAPQKDPKYAIGLLKAGLGRRALEHCELVAQSHVLQNKLPPRLDPRIERTKHDQNHMEHRRGMWPVAPKNQPLTGLWDFRYPQRPLAWVANPSLPRASSSQGSLFVTLAIGFPVFHPLIALRCLRSPRTGPNADVMVFRYPQVFSQAADRVSAQDELCIRHDEIQHLLA